MTQTAERVYREIGEEAQTCIESGDHTNSKVTRYNMLSELIEKIIPHDPFNRGRALSGSLSNIFRVSKGRMRACYIGSSEKRELIVLYISDTPRKQGDTQDPYRIFTRMVFSGRFDELFERLGVRIPDRKQSESRVAVH